MLVVDASAIVELLLSTPTGRRTVERIGTDHSLHSPDLLGIEVVSVLRRLTARGEITAADAERAVAELGALGIETYEHAPLLDRMFGLRDVLTAYDAAHVALAEGLTAPLLTCDAQLARSHGHDAVVELATTGT
ncbi:MAG: type II toxin-antitoxin system VapC family toxin [Acidimicrobiia bacterium]